MAARGLRFVSLGLVAALLLGTKSEAQVVPEGIPCFPDEASCNASAGGCWYRGERFPCVPCPPAVGRGWTCPILQEPPSAAVAKAAPQGDLPICLPSQEMCDLACNEFFHKDCVSCPEKAGWWSCPAFPTAPPAAVEAVEAKAAPAAPQGFPCVPSQTLCNWGCQAVFHKDCTPCPFAADEWLCLPPISSTEVVKAAPAAPQGFPCVPSQTLCNWGCQAVFHKDCTPCPFAADEWLCVPYL